MSTDILTICMLNRAFLARQMLIARAPMTALDAIEHLVGLQSQAPNPPYVGLWTRLENFGHDDLSRLIVEREAVRIALMRSTIHLVSAGDCLMFRPLIQPVLERAFKTTYGRSVVGLDLFEIGAVGRALVEDQPLTFGELGVALQRHWTDRDAHALAQTVRTFVPLVQVPPRGLWGQSGQSTHTSAEAWLGRPLDPDPDHATLFRRYLGAFGPASVRDFQTWSGLTGMRSIAERLQPELLAFTDEQGRELFDLPDAPRPDPATPAPIRFLPEFDNALLSHADRTRIIAAAHRPRVFTVNGIIRGTVLVEGFVGATWKIDRARDSATLMIEPFVEMNRSDRDDIVAEADRLLAFAAEDVTTRTVRILDAV